MEALPASWHSVFRLSPASGKRGAGPRLEAVPELQEAVLGNVGTLLAFRLGPADAEKLQSYTKPEVDALGLQELPNFHAAARLLANGAPLRPFVFRTLPTEEFHGPAEVPELLAVSRERYTRRRDVVELAILERRREAEATVAE